MLPQSGILIYFKYPFSGSLNPEGYIAGIKQNEITGMIKIETL